MDYVSGLLWAILGFSILVFIHEFGHFLFARWTGIGVETFSIGFGRAIVKFNYKGVLWKIGWMPFGGFCKMKGQEDFGKPETKGEPDEFYQRPPWARLLAVLGGPVFNIILGMLILTGVYFFIGEEILKNNKIKVKAKYAQKLELKDGDVIYSINGKEVHSWNEVREYISSNILYHDQQLLMVKRNDKLIPITYNLDKDIMLKGEIGFTIDIKQKISIREVRKNSPAEKAGMQKGDVIISIDDKPIQSVGTPQQILNNDKIDVNFKHKFVLLRNDKKIELWVKPEQEIIENQKKVRRIGIALDWDYPKEYLFTKKYSLLESFPKGIEKAGKLMSLAIMQFKILSELKPKTVQENVSGPVGIITLIGKAGNAGIIPYVNFIAVISILLGVFNLLPIPAVDGGHIVITLFEMIRRKPLSFKIIQRVQLIGFFIIISLIVLFTINDLYKLIF